MVPSWLKTLFPRRTIRPTRANRARPTAKPGLVQLEDRAVPAGISIADVSIAEGNAGTQTLMFTVTADAAEAADITFNFDTADGGATAGSDYVAVAGGTGKILAGATTTKVSVTINGDNLVELDESFTVTLSNLSAGNAFTDDTATGTITNDDQAKISITSPLASEGSPLGFSITISNPVDVAVTADRKTADGSATTAGSDYTAIANGNVQLFAANSTTAFVLNVATTADNTVELDETLSAILSNLAATGRNVIFTGGGATLTGTGTINNDDTTNLTIADSSAVEGTAVLFTASLTNPVDTDVTIKLTPSKAGGNTATATTDFSTAAQTITILAGALSGSASVTTVPDTVVEADETFTATLSNVAAGGREGDITVADGMATGTITNDDTTVLTITSGTFGEGDGMVDFTITSSNAVQGGFTVDYKTNDGTATAGKDYTAETNTEAFTGTAGETETFDITILNDTIVEADETFILSLLNIVTVGGISPAAFDLTNTGTGTINSGDTAQFRITANVSANEGSPITFTITLTNQVQATTSVTLTTAGGTATAGTDYTDATGMVVTFDPLVTSKTFSVITSPDNTVEANETFNFSIGGLNDGGLVGDVTIDGAQDSRIGTITNDDSAQFKITKSASAVEGSPVLFDVTLTNPVDVATSVTVTTANGTANQGSDYTKLNGVTVNFAAGDVSETVMVVTDDDPSLEADETFTITLGGLNNGGRGTVTIDGANSVGTGTIVDNDGAVVMIDDVSKSEDGTSMTFTVTLVGAVQDGFIVEFKANNGTATSGDNDFTLAPGSLSFFGNDGETKTITVTLNDDNKVEADEAFTIELFNLVPSTVKASSINITDKGNGTITNDDAAQFKIAAVASATEGSKVSFAVTLTNPVDVATSVTVTTADVTAVAGSDYTALAGVTVNFAANVVNQTVMVTTTADNTVEADETFTIALGGLNDGGRKVTIDAANANGTGTITNDDSAAFSIANSSATEGDTITFTITLSNPVSTDTSVTVTTADLTAVDGTDYTGLVGVTVMFAAGTTSKTVTVDTTADAIVEADETFKAILGGLVDGGFPGKVTISGANGTATGTITNDDSTALTILDVAQLEADGAMKFTVTLSQAVQGGFKVDFKTNDGSATTADNDYDTATGTLTFAGTVGETQSFLVTVNDDNKVELDQLFTVSLFNVVPTDAGVSPAKIVATDTATGTIQNDDAAQFKITPTGSAIEGNQVKFTVTLTNPVDAATSVTVTTTDGTAKSVGAPAFDNDFVALSSKTINFAANVTSVDVFVTTNADSIVELDETFTIDLGGLDDGGRKVTISAADSTGAGTITNDDAAQFKIVSASAVEGGPIAFTVTLTNPVDVATSVTVTTADITAEAGKDYTALVGKVVNFVALDTGETVTVLTTADGVVEADETFSATLGGLVSGGRAVTISAADKTATGTITNDDSASLSIEDVAVNEATGTITFTVVLAGDVQGGFAVDIKTADLTATVADGDYVAGTKTLNFAGTNGEVQMFTVTLNDDNKVEADETFKVSLSNAVPNDAKVNAAKIAIADTATGTILNDDKTALTIADVFQGENAGPMTFTVTLTNPVQGGLKVDFATFDGTALVGNNDYNAKSGTLTFAGTAGETQTFSVTINGDATIEPDEFFTTKLSNVVTLGAGVSAAKVIATDTATGNILSDDKSVIDLAASTDAEGKNLVYTVTLSNPISKDVSVDFATLAGVGLRPATSGVDFTAVAKTVTFLAGTTKVTVLVPITDDRRVEGSEQFDAKVSNFVADPSVLGALSFGKAQDTATITDNDTAVFAFTQAANAAKEDNLTGFSATVQLVIVALGTGTDGLDRSITVRTLNSGGSATVGDFGNTVTNILQTFAPGDFTTSSQKIFFDVFEDLNKEGDETIVFNLTVANDATAGQAKIGATNVHTFTIQSDDEAVRTYDATVAGDYRFVNDGAGNVQLFLGPTLLSTDKIGTQAIQLNGTAGVDSATVDYVNGSPVPSGGIAFNANGPAAGERFLVSGGNFASILSAFTGSQSGTLTLTGTTTDALSYTNVDAVEINAASVGSLTLQLPAGASQAILEDDGIPGNGISQIRSANGTFATTKFVSPTGTLTVTPGNAADTLAIEAMPDNSSSLFAGSAANRFSSISQNGAVASNGQVRYFGNDVAVGANLTAAGSVELNATGTVTLGDTTITGNDFAQTGGTVAITAGKTATIAATGSAGTTITFTGAINGPGSLATSSAGNSIFNQPIGAGTALANATFGSPIVANGTTAVVGGTTGGALNIAANTIAFNAPVSAPNAPLVLALTGGSATQTSPFTTTKLYLNGNGNFDLSNPGNQLTAVPLGSIASFIGVNGSKVTTNIPAIQGLPGELFANLTGGSINVRDKTDLVIRFENPAVAAIQVGGNGSATLSAGGDVSIEDPQSGNVPAASQVPLLNVGTGTVQVNVGVDRDDPSQSTVVRYLAEATASFVILGQPPSPTQKFVDRVGIGELENVAKDTFTVRPMIGSQLTVNGNSPIVLDGKDFRPFDTLSPQFAGIGNTSLTPGGNGDGTFTFGSGGFQPLNFTSIETLGGFQSQAFVVQTGPRIDDPSNEYAVRLMFSLSIAGSAGPTQINTKVVGSGIITNPFVVTPSSSSAQTVFSPPKVTFGEFDGDGVPDLVLVNGAGDAPLVTIVKGSRLTQQNPDGSVVPLDLSKLQQSDLVAQFVAFEESFRGGLNVATGDFDNDGRAEIAVSAGTGGGPRITVFKIDLARPVFSNADIFRNAAGVAYNFFPYESSFRGGVNVAVGDVNGDRVPDIIAGAGFGGGPRVRVFDGGVGPASTIADFFAYDPGFRGGVFVDAGRFDSDAIADLVTAPGPGGSAHIQVFQGQNNPTQPFAIDAVRGAEYRQATISFFAFESQPSLFDPQPQRSGVGGVVFGASTDGFGALRSILVTRPRGSSFEFVKFDLVDNAATLTDADVANGASFINVAPLGLRLKQTPNFQNVITDRALDANGNPILDANGNPVSLNGVFLDPDNRTAAGFQVLRDGGSAGGFS